MANPKYKYVSIGGGYRKKVSVEAFNVRKAKNLKQLQRAVEKINPEIMGEAWRDTFEGMEGEITAIVVNRMYEEGLRRAASGGGTEPIEPDYAHVTRYVYKRKKGQRTDHVTLRDTGRFHESLRLVYTADGFYVRSDGSVPYSRKLEDRYTRRIYGLTSGEMAEFTRQRGSLKEIALRALAKAGQWT